jgi:hypothetical protein
MSQGQKAFLKGVAISVIAAFVYEKISGYVKSKSAA